MYLTWHSPGVYTDEVSVDLTVLEDVDPSETSFVYWALQVNFVEANGQTSRGAAHVGLMYNAGYTASNKHAVNWGGYDDYHPTESFPDNIFEGSISDLPSEVGDENTRDFDYVVGRRYRLRVFKSPKQDWGSGETTSGVAQAEGEIAWRATVTDTTTGTTTVIRDLLIPDSHQIALHGCMVWTEDAHVTKVANKVRWSTPMFGDTEITQGAATYHVDMPDSDVSTDSIGWVMEGETTRVTAADTVLQNPSRPLHLAEVRDHTGLNEVTLYNSPYPATGNDTGFSFYGSAVVVDESEPFRAAIDASGQLTAECLFKGQRRAWMGISSILRYGWYGFHLTLEGGGAVAAQYDYFDGSAQFVKISDDNSGLGWADDQWHHLAMTYDGSYLRLYIDAVLRATSSYNENPPYMYTAGTNEFAVGRNGPFTNSYYLWGQTVDEVALYDKALSAARIAAHYNAKREFVSRLDGPKVGILPVT